MKKTIFLFFIVLVGLLTTSSYFTDTRNINSKHFSFEIPTNMIEAKDLNAEALYQFSYVEYLDNELLELYFILIEETHKEIKSYKLGYEFTTMSYWEIAVENLVGGIDEHQILTKDIKVETLNGMECVRSDIFGKLGDIQVVYHLGVFQNERAFYQVLTWTIADQREHFKTDMENIISSFKQKK